MVYKNGVFSDEKLAVLKNICVLRFFGHFLTFLRTTLYNKRKKHDQGQRICVFEQ